MLASSSLAATSIETFGAGVGSLTELPDESGLSSRAFRDNAKCREAHSTAINTNSPDQIINAMFIENPCTLVLFAKQPRRREIIAHPREAYKATHTQLNASDAPLRPTAGLSLQCALADLLPDAAARKARRPRFPPVMRKQLHDKRL